MGIELLERHMKQVFAKSQIRFKQAARQSINLLHYFSEGRYPHRRSDCGCPTHDKEEVLQLESFEKRMIEKSAYVGARTKSTQCVSTPKPLPGTKRDSQSSQESSNSQSSQDSLPGIPRRRSSDSELYQKPTKREF